MDHRTEGQNTNRRVGGRLAARRTTRTAGTTPRRLRILTALLLLVGAAGCDSILEVENEQDILGADLDDPAAVSAIANGVAGDFAVAYMDWVISVALYSNELIHTGSFPSWREWEQGIARRPSSKGGQLYDNLARAAFVADDAVTRFRRILDDADAREETAAALAWGGFTRGLLADGFCQATFNGGPPVDPPTLYADAETRLTDAIRVAEAAGSAVWRNRAHALRAHVRLVNGDWEGARADARVPPPGFRFDVLYSTNSERERNDVASFTRTGIRREAGVHPRFYTDPAYRADPRTPFLDRGPNETGPDPTRQFVEQDLYRTEDAAIPASTWQELRLIEAEAELELGAAARAAALLDEVRLAAGLPAYPATDDATTVRARLFHERSAELWLRGRLWKDLKRTNAPRVAEVRDLCWELSEQEWQTNPHLEG